VATVTNAARGRAARWRLPIAIVAAALTVLLGVGVMLVNLRQTTSRTPRFRPPAGRVYLGVSTDFSRLDAFDSAAGLTGPPAVFGRWTTPDGPFAPILDDVRRRPGLAPLIHWNLPLDNDRVSDGSRDAYIAAQARAVAAYGRPTFVRLDWEFNSQAYPQWNLPAVTPEQYVASWRHVVAMFSHVPNVAFVWSPTTWSGPNATPTAAWWPGDDVVDWVGLDAYPQSADRDYLLRGRDGMDDMAALAALHRKPLMVAEWAPDLPHPDTIAAMTLILKWAADHPVVQALVYFDFVTGGKDYLLAHHPVGAAEFRRQLRTDHRYLFTVS
jgi:hypothetical protein